MSTALPDFFLPSPDWCRLRRFALFAIALHGFVLAWPLPARQVLTPPQPISVEFRPHGKEAPAPRTDDNPPPPRTTARPEKSRPQPVIKHFRETPLPPVANAAPSDEPSRPALPAATSTAPQASPGKGDAAAPLVQTTARFDAAYLRNPVPPYPAISRRLGEEGKVLLRVRVGADGLPIAVNLEKSSNFPRLDEAARQGVERWRFVPARLGEQAVEASVIVPVLFRLEN